jgi:hypothetical protein
MTGSKAKPARPERSDVRFHPAAGYHLSIVRDAEVTTVLDDRASEDEVFAAFGLAALRANEFERVLVTFLETVLPAGRVRVDPLGAEGSRIPALGHMTTQVRDAGGSEALLALLQVVTDTRNSLFHHYFWERPVEFITTEGRAAMATELREIGVKLEAATRDLPKVLLEWAASAGHIPPIDPKLARLIALFRNPN